MLTVGLRIMDTWVVFSPCDAVSSYLLKLIETINNRIYQYLNVRKLYLENLQKKLLRHKCTKTNETYFTRALLFYLDSFTLFTMILLALVLSLIHI